MEVDQKNQKDMSLADIIKNDKAGGKGGATRGGRDKRGGRGGRGGRDNTPRQAGGQNLMKARRNEGGIHKTKPFRSGGPNVTREQRENRKQKQQQVNSPSGSSRGAFKSGGPGQRRFSDERRPQSGGRGGRGAPALGGATRQHPRSAGARGGAEPGFRSRGGLARGGARQALARPKRLNEQKTIRLGDKKLKPEFNKSKSWAPSDKRLKVRNFDEKQVSNDDLKKLFAKIGEIKICKFDRNEFGQFLGSATVTYERFEDAKQAIDEYNGAFLDEKVLVVEYDMVVNRSDTKPGQAVNKLSGGVIVQKQLSSNKGKTLHLQQNR